MDLPLLNAALWTHRDGCDVCPGPTLLRAHATCALGQPHPVVGGRHRRRSGANGGGLPDLLFWCAIYSLFIRPNGRRHALREQGLSFLIAALVGGGAAVTSAVALAWAFALPNDVWLSLVPKSITAPVAMGVAEKIGGITALAAVFAVLTGLVGALSGRYLFDAMGLGFDRIGWTARGFALGTAAHGIGAARATQVNADAGAFAGLALGLQVILGSLILPLIWQYL